MIRKDRCVGCLKYFTTQSEVVVNGGVFYYHAKCLKKLKDGMVKPDNKAMFKELSKAFSKVLNKEARE